MRKYFFYYVINLIDFIDKFRILVCPRLNQLQLPLVLQSVYSTVILVF
jgi:hypothetical protein